MNYSFGFTQDDFTKFLTIAFKENYNYTAGRKNVQTFINLKATSPAPEINLLEENRVDFFIIVLTFLSREYRIDLEGSKGLRTQQLDIEFNKDLLSYFTALNNLSKIPNVFINIPNQDV